MQQARHSQAQNAGGEHGDAQPGCEHPMGQLGTDRLGSQPLEYEPSAGEEAGSDQNDAGDTQYSLDDHRTLTR